MNDMPKILIGLVIFVVLAAFPIGYNLATPDRGAAPDLVIYTADDPGLDTCVLPTEEMRTRHMDLLMDWREEVVRTGERTYVDEHNRTHLKSLSLTCLSCHPNKDTFCDRCHGYVDVTPYCWDCHTTPDDVDRGGWNQ